MASTVVSFIRGKFLIPFKIKKIYIYIQSELCTENLYAEPVRLWIFIITELYPWVHSLQSTVNIKCQAQMLCEGLAGAGRLLSHHSAPPSDGWLHSQGSPGWAAAPDAGGMEGHHCLQPGILLGCWGRAWRKKKCVELVTQKCVMFTNLVLFLLKEV